MLFHNIDSFKNYITVNYFFQYYSESFSAFGIKNFLNRIRAVLTNRTKLGIL